jgi:hypothetical protein
MSPVLLAILLFIGNVAVGGIASLYHLKLVRCMSAVEADAKKSEGNCYLVVSGTVSRPTFEGWRCSRCEEIGKRHVQRRMGKPQWQDQRRERYDGDHSACHAAQDSAQKLLYQNGDAPDKQPQPLADLYPNCTVLFADIVGKVKILILFCARRCRLHIFMLLEGLSSKFDRFAKRLGVFKGQWVAWS